MTPNVVALTKKVTEVDAAGGNLRKQTKVWFAAADKENQEPNAKAAAGKETRPRWLLKMINIGGYCWSCGYNPMGKSHTSATCKRKAPGHKDDATASNRKAGSEANKPEWNSNATKWTRVTKGKIKNSSANKLIKAKSANYFPYALANIVRKVTVTKPKHNTSTSGSSRGHSSAAKISRNSQKSLARESYVAHSRQ